MSAPSASTLAMQDAAARKKALEPGRSFIVQAPAGSGKTELLIQRYLVLLSLAREPEEIAAITFTRKAAAEMKLRVLRALDEARTGNGEEALPEHHRDTRRLARQVLARESELGWNLSANSQRLRIQTFDALCASLTRQMPVLSAFGAQPRSLEDASALYREAAKATLAQLDDEAPHANDIALLLTHLDNNLDAVVEMLAAMLARRDHWLPHISHANQREWLEQGLASARVAARRSAAASFPSASLDELFELARYAAGNLKSNESQSPIVDCDEIEVLPGSGEEHHQPWLGLADLLLTNEGEWRKPGGLNVKLGFPAGISKVEKESAKSWKARHAALTDSLSIAPGLADSLHALRSLPASAYQDEQWQMLGAIARLLPLAVAQLQLAFAARGEADFVEVAQRANLALGEPEAPTDLLLALDYRIHHLLVDEFQDTSYTQFALLEKLTAGWNAGDIQGESTEKTLFLVGDPMQSIYRFRQAEVGLFLRAQRSGLGGITLESLTLSANFRSRAGIVNWVNAAFESVMPARDDMATGAVSYAPSQAARVEECGVASDSRVSVHAGFDGANAQANRVAEIVLSARERRPEGTLAVLVRNRSHLRAIVPALRQAGLAFQAIEIEPLGHRQAVRDVYSLTRALAHAEDRVAWLAVLRAPWCGLMLADLQALAGTSGNQSETKNSTKQQDLFSLGNSPRAIPADIDSNNGLKTIWEAICSPAPDLSSDGRGRIVQLRETLGPIVNNPMRGSLRARVETAWLLLGGPACVAEVSDIDDVDIYFDCLAQNEQAGEIADVAAFDQAVAGLYALPDAAADARLQIMTIHKAKGLEFDTVIVPGLHAGGRGDEKHLLAWMETPLEQGSEQVGQARGTLLIAPINPMGSDEEPTYQYLRQLEKVKARHEETRLLYVAATRAREELHWLGEARLDKNGEVSDPSSNSLLARLWPVMQAEFSAQHAANSAVGDTPIGQGVVAHDAQIDSSRSSKESVGISQVLRRLKTGWQLPELPKPLQWNAPAADEAGRGAVEFSWAGETARHVGSVVHRWMQRIAEEGLEGWNDARVEGLREVFQAQLAARGVVDAECAAGASRVAESLKRTLSDPRGQWLLGDRREARSEYRLTSMSEAGRHDWVIDRTFVDDEGSRWIVDFKTSRHDETDVDAFLDREVERYRGQLEGYAKLLAKKPEDGGGVNAVTSSGKKVHLGLYFPLLGGWREWIFHS